MKLHTVPKAGPDSGRELLTKQSWSLHGRKESKGERGGGLTISPSRTHPQ